MAPHDRNESEGLILSISPLYPKEQSEGALFLAFGVALALAFIRWQQPALFADPTAALAAAILGSSIVASVLFYTRPDRLVPRCIVWLCCRKYGQTLADIIVRLRLALEMWRVKTTLSWDEPLGEAKWTVKRTVEDRGLRREVWVVTAWFFFVPALVLVLYAYVLPPVDGLFWTLVVCGVTGAATAWHSRSLLHRLFVVSAFRLAQDNYGVFKAADPGNRPTQNWFIGDSTSLGKDPPIGGILEELEAKLERRDMEGFQVRFARLDSDMRQWVGEVYKGMYELIVAQWTSYLMADGEIAKRNLLSRVSYVMKVAGSLGHTAEWQEAVKDHGDLKQIYDLSSDDLKDLSVLFQRCDSLRIRFGIPSSLLPLLSRSVSGTVPEEVLPVLIKWAGDRVRDFDRILLKAGEGLEETKSRAIAELLARYADRGILSQSGPVMAARIMLSRAQDENLILSLLHSGNPETVFAAVHHIKNEEWYLLRDVLALVEHPNRHVVFELLYRLEERRLLETSVRKMIAGEDNADIKRGVLIAIKAAFELGEPPYPGLKHPLVGLILESESHVIAMFLEEAGRAGHLTTKDVDSLLPHLVPRGDYNRRLEPVLNQIRAKLERTR